MSLDVYLTDAEGREVFSANITHNLGAMAKEAGIYMHLWRPDELGTPSPLIRATRAEPQGTPRSTAQTPSTIPTCWADQTP